MSNRTAREHRDIGCPAADVHQAHAEILLVVVQNGLGGRERLKHHVADFETAAAHALGQIFDGRHRARHDMHFHFQPHTAHAERIVDVFLTVDDEFLRQDVQNLLIVGNRDGLRGFDDTIDVRLRDLFFLDRHHAARIQTADVAAGDAGVDLADPTVRHQLGFLDHALDRRHRCFDIDDDAFLEPARRLRAHANDVERAVIRNLRNDRRDFRRADVETHDQVLFLHHPTTTVSGHFWLCLPRPR